MAAPRVFLSYADDDLWWVRDCFKPYFNIGNVVLVDCKADDIAFGELKTALDEYLEGSVAVVAFVSENYIKQEGTVAAWEKSLSETNRRRLIFVPVMLDADGIDWWQRLRRSGGLSSLSRDYQFANFTDGGAYALPGPAKPQYIQKIAKLAEKLREEIFRAPDPRRVVTDPQPPRPPVGPVAPHDEPVVAPNRPRFDVALSFPGARRNYVRQVADSLVRSLGSDRIFFDENFRAELARPNSDILLQNIYRKQSKLVVVFASAEYEQSEWCGLEWRVMRDLIKARDDASIMFMRFDDAEIPGLLSIDGYIDLRNFTAAEAADLIRNRLELGGRAAARA
jgi:hypothetical protein